MKSYDTPAAIRIGTFGIDRCAIEIGGFGRRRRGARCAAMPLDRPYCSALGLWMPARLSRQRTPGERPALRARAYRYYGRLHARLSKNALRIREYVGLMSECITSGFDTILFLLQRAADIEPVRAILLRFAAGRQR